MKRYVLVAALALDLPSLALLPACTNCCCKAERGEKDEKNDEVKVALADCPKPVQATLNKEAAGGKIDEIVKESEDGKTIYSADVTIAGKYYEINIAEDGTLLSKKLETDNDEGDQQRRERP